MPRTVRICSLSTFVWPKGMAQMPRGIRNNNPGNIRHAKVLWQGEAATQTDPSFVQFTKPEFGIRAIAKILITYKKNGINTLGAAISRWAPPSENNTYAYIQTVCKDCGVGQYDPVDLEGLLPKLIPSIINHENGIQPYSDALIAQGISLARG